MDCDREICLQLGERNEVSLLFHLPNILEILWILPETAGCEMSHAFILVKSDFFVPLWEHAHWILPD